MLNIKKQADNFNPLAQRDCYGLGECVFFLFTLWTFRKAFFKRKKEE